MLFEQNAHIPHWNSKGQIYQGHFRSACWKTLAIWLRLEYEPRLWSFVISTKSSAEFQQLPIKSHVIYQDTAKNLLKFQIPICRSFLCLQFLSEPCVLLLHNSKCRLTLPWQDCSLVFKFYIWTSTPLSSLVPYDLQAIYTNHFLILVISHAGKMTLLRRVCQCNITEDSCIYYDENNKDLVSVYKPEDEFCLRHSLPAWTYLSGTPLNRYVIPMCLIFHISEGYTTSIGRSHPGATQIYFPRFSWIRDRWREATEGSLVVYREESKVDRDWSTIRWITFMTLIIIMSIAILHKKWKRSSENHCTAPRADGLLRKQVPVDFVQSVNWSAQHSTLCRFAYFRNR